MENPTSPKKFFVISSAQGCVTNLLETTTIRNSINPALYERAKNEDEADVIFVNTCGYNDAAEKTSLDVITGYQNRFPKKKIIVGGCLPRINSEGLEAVFKGDIVRTGDVKALNQVLEASTVDVEKATKESSEIDASDLDTRLSSNRTVQKIYPYYSKLENLFGTEFYPLHNILQSLIFDKKTYAISVARGCLGRCNYCAIKKAKGRLVSRKLVEIVDEFQAALQKGYTRFHLAADDVGCWGQDVGLDSAKLLSALFRIRGDYQLIIDYFDPTWLTRLFDPLLEPLSDPRMICINAPMQSGSTPLLHKMSREYDADTVLEQLSMIKQKNPRTVMKTHILVGYPGETAEDFKKSLEILRHFDLIFPNKFGPRPGTPAAEMEQLPEHIRKYRFERLKLSILARHSKVLLHSLFRPSSLTPSLASR
ncbi:radical SAM protein [bacterium]|nr:radical SAM protein [bacterium]